MWMFVITAQLCVLCSTRTLYMSLSSSKVSQLSTQLGLGPSSLAPCRAAQGPLLSQF